MWRVRFVQMRALGVQLLCGRLRVHAYAKKENDGWRLNSTIPSIKTASCVQCLRLVVAFLVVNMATAPVRAQVAPVDAGIHLLSTAGTCNILSALAAALPLYCILFQMPGL